MLQAFKLLDMQLYYVFLEHQFYRASPEDCILLVQFPGFQLTTILKNSLQVHFEYFTQEVEAAN